MEHITTLLFLVCIIMSACSGENKPATGDLKKALSLQLPGHMLLDSFSVEASQNLGNKVEPLYAVRFQATIKAMVDLYEEDRKEPNVRLVSLVSNRGKKTDIFGKISSRLYQGVWQHDIDIDGNPFASLGIPLTQFSGGRVFIRGSDEEKKYYSELRNNIVNAKKILIGTWREDEFAWTYKTDESCRGIKQNGYEVNCVWHIQGDILTINFTQAKQDGKLQKINFKSSHQITYIDNNSYSLKESGGRMWQATRLQ